MPKRMTLHLTYLPTSEIRQRLDHWNAAVRRDTDLSDGAWRLLVLWEAARDASVSGSTGIEGNPLSPAQVSEVLNGAAVDASAAHVREVLNYNAALDLARAAVSRPGFSWSHEIVHQVNAAVMRGLPQDAAGRYRQAGEDVHVGIYTGPSPMVVGALMGELVEWLGQSRGSPSLIRSALAHLNVIAIHPFNDGNGRTARIVAAMTLMEDGIEATELLSIESFLRRNRDEYIAALRTTLGLGYDPDDHPVTEWLDYYTRVSLDRLAARDRILDALPGDIGLIFTALADSGDPGDWAPLLLAARVTRLRTERVARMTGRSGPAARALLARLVDAGWLVPQGRTRGRWHAPSERLVSLPLRAPRLMERLAAGDALRSFDD